MKYALLAGLMLAQTIAPTVPQITDAQRAAYWKAQAEYQQAQAVMQQRQAAVQQASQALAEACGKDFTPGLDAKGDLVCVAKGAK